MKRVLLSGLLLLLGAAPATFAQGAKDVIINELLVKNRNNYQDDYGHRVSWIELRNAGHSKIDLASCYLVLETNGKNFSYRIPKGDTRTTLAPGGYVVFFCEGSETKGTFHTNFTLTGDQFASHFGKPQSATTDFYETSSVLLQADTTVFLEAAENMTATSEALSAPVTIRFTAYANEPVASLYIWKIYKTEEGADNALIRFTEPEVEYTFSEYGKYTAEVEVSDRTGKCYASYPFEIEVAESFLDVPNAFSPGTTPGVNDEFRVAYKSLVKFSSLDKSGGRLGWKKRRKVCSARCLFLCDRSRRFGWN